MSARLALPFALLLAAGCGDPTVYPITGKVTLGGKPYERLIVHFRPVGRPASMFNIGVGETDKAGNLKLRASGGDGVEAGEYKVMFTLQVVKSGKGNQAVGADEKPDEVAGGGTVVELVPDEYLAGKGEETTPVRFTVKPGQENRFEFDVPAKKK
jgi:hypothetical protein